MAKYAENTSVSAEKSRAETCKSGHALTPDNVYIWAKAPLKRQCRTCQSRRSLQFKERAKIARQATVQLERNKWSQDLTPSDLAWAAGLFEGEGTVTITRAGRKGYSRPIVSVTSTDPEITDFFQQRWVGTITVKRPAGARARIAYEWRLGCAWKIEIFIEQVLPFIRTCRVRNKMELVFEACKHRQQGSRNKDYRGEREAYRETIREMNRRGTHDGETVGL